MQNVIQSPQLTKNVYDTRDFRTRFQSGSHTDSLIQNSLGLCPGRLWSLLHVGHAHSPLFPSVRKDGVEERGLNVGQI